LGCVSHAIHVRFVVDSRAIRIRFARGSLLLFAVAVLGGPLGGSLSGGFDLCAGGVAAALEEVVYDVSSVGLGAARAVVAGLVPQADGDELAGLRRGAVCLGDGGWYVPLGEVLCGVGPAAQPQTERGVPGSHELGVAVGRVIDLEPGHRVGLRSVERVRVVKPDPGALNPRAPAWLPGGL
jgi:hypothetical protein